ncbi:MAG: lipoyl synthase [Kiritimatiellae bacterium]|jgi:lipoic acid synthetase|nr:lipoyl synthase [Kiritimatiellia bacterium]
MKEKMKENSRKLPPWLKIRVKADNENFDYVEEMLSRLNLNTVCQEANCPNRLECFAKKTSTFMILGAVCTRNCKFCNVFKGETENVDFNEPTNVALATKELGLKHVVITSVTRDDLKDGGAGQFVKTINLIKEHTPETTIEVLIPDFQGDAVALQQVIDAKPQIINHNIETVPRLYPEVRALADYKRSLQLLKNVKEADNEILTKSGIMVGLGETKDEVVQTLHDLFEYGCELLTIGQYLAPSKDHYPVYEYIHPDVFEEYKVIAKEIGFKFVASAPLVRSSYNAEEMLRWQSQH